MRKIGLFVLLAFFILALPAGAACRDYHIGTWKTAQTIQPFFYEKYISPETTIRVFSFTNPADQKLALLAGSLDMCGTTLAHAIHSASRGEPVVVVASLCNKCSALVVRKGGPIHSIADMRGKKIGYVPGTMHEILLRETLRHAGLSPERDVRMTRVDFFDMGTALANGGIDAFVSGEPFPAAAVTKGYGTILAYPYYDEAIGTINAGMLVHRETIRKHPDTVLELVRAHARATEYLKMNKSKWLARASLFGTDIDVLEEASSNMELTWDMDENLLKKARMLGQRMEELGVITRQPDYNRLFDLNFVRKVKGDAGGK